MNLKLTEKYQVLTPNGWNNFKGVKQSQSPYLIKFFFENKKSIKVTPDHQFVVNGSIYIANDLKVLDVIESKTGLLKIVNIEREINEKDMFNVYDLYDVNNRDHVYYTNDIISHNCCDFILSGETIINPEYIEWMNNNSNFVKVPIGKEGPEGEFWIWSYPQDGKSYIVSADIAKGNEGDYSTAEIICVETFEQVAEYRSKKVDPERFGQFLVKQGIDYNNALLVPENNNYGQRTIQKIIDLNYPNFFYYDKKFKGIIFPEFRETLKQQQKEPGWPTNPKNRTMILTNLADLIRESVRDWMKDNPGGLIIHSSRFINELKSWETIDGRMDHAKGKHDDLIIAMAIGCFIKTVYSRITEGERKNAIEFMKFFSNNKENIDMNFGIQAPKSNIHKELDLNGESISWLLKD